eukprot:gene12234-8420_t
MRQYRRIVVNNNNNNNKKEDYQQQHPEQLNSWWSTAETGKRCLYGHIPTFFLFFEESYITREEGITYSSQSSTEQWRIYLFIDSLCLCITILLLSHP